MRIKDTELKAVIAALEADLSSAFEASKATLMKADDEKSPPAESTDDSAMPPEESSTEESSPKSASLAPEGSPGMEASSKMGEGSPGMEDEGSVPPSESPASAASAPESAESAPADPAAEGSDAHLTPEMLQAEYAQLSPEELEMHLQAAMAAKESLAASAGAGAGAPPAASPGAAASAPGMAGKMPPPAMKKEPAEHHGHKDQMDKSSYGKMGKSESGDVLAALKAEVDMLKKSLEAKDKVYAEDVENLSKAVKMVLEAPQRKAVTSISYLSKGETPVANESAKEFSPAEARAKLNELIPTLSKSERQLVLDFYSGKVSATKLAPLFEKASK